MLISWALIAHGGDLAGFPNPATTVDTDTWAANHLHASDVRFRKRSGIEVFDDRMFRTAASFVYDVVSQAVNQLGGIAEAVIVLEIWIWSYRVPT